MPPLFNAVQFQPQDFHRQWQEVETDENQNVPAVPNGNGGGGGGGGRIPLTSDELGIPTPVKSERLYTAQDLARQRLSKGVRYFYNTRGTLIVWKNVILLTIIHILAAYGVYLLIYYKCWDTWVFSYAYGALTAIGVTSGGHRLWSHKAFKAKTPLRIFLMICHCSAGQGSLLEWCRDHRTHHKFSETDADPHDSRRGFFFAHMGWLLSRKHPEVIRKGRQIDMSDLLNDPVVRFQIKYYFPLAFFWCILFPAAITRYVYGIPWLDSIIGCGFWRYLTGLHCTWFVNSAAHMWGNQPYNKAIAPCENKFVSFGAFGEGFHNYHHTYPWDYATSESGWSINISTIFIDFMAFIGQAYDLRRADVEIVRKQKAKTAKLSLSSKKTHASRSPVRRSPTRHS